MIWGGLFGVFAAILEKGLTQKGGMGSEPNRRGHRFCHPCILLRVHGAWRRYRLGVGTQTEAVDHKIFNRFGSRCHGGRQPDGRLPCRLGHLGSAVKGHNQVNGRLNLDLYLRRNDR